MEPMKPMEPMQPMKPMAPLDSTWWPKGLTHPSSTGQQGRMRYAFFAAQRRLVLESAGHVTQYDTGHHHITGVSQASGAGGARFTSQEGEIDLSRLHRVD